MSGTTCAQKTSSPAGYRYDAAQIKLLEETSMNRVARVMVAMSMMAGGGSFAASDVRLIPGIPVEFEVPEAPPSMANQLRNQVGEPVRMTIKLPRDYDESRLYPALVFLNGGDGGKGGELNMAEPFLGDAGYVLCNIPIFKQVHPTDRDEVKWSVTPVDGPYLLPAFRLMLDELRRRVPNIDSDRSVLAGFSNGAAAIAVVLWSGDPDLLARFGAYVLVEGGFWLGSDYDHESGQRFRAASFSGLQGKRVAIAYGEQATPADRIPWIRAARGTSEALRRAGVAVYEMPMPGIGHDFPPTEMQRIRKWLIESGARL
jgi:predicted esterase